MIVYDIYMNMTKRFKVEMTFFHHFRNGWNSGHNSDASKNTLTEQLAYWTTSTVYMGAGVHDKLSERNGDDIKS